MNPLADGQPQAAFDPGEAYQRCMHELGKPHPDYQAANLYATLSPEEALRDIVAQLDHLARTLVVAT